MRTNTVRTPNLPVLFIIGSMIFLSISCGNKAEPKEAEIFTVVEELPQPEGGMDSFYSYVQNEIRYPLLARENGIEGRVYVEFVVERDGSLSDVKIAKGIGNECDSEALRVINSANPFNPGKQRGRTVRVRMVIPITYAFDNENTNADGSPKGVIIVGEADILPEQLKVDASFSEGEWSGTIYTQDGEPLPGTNIVVKGTTYGTVSDLDGTFSIDAEKSQELVISFVGYKTEVLKVD